MIRGDRPPRVFGGDVAFEDLRDFFVACSGVQAADAHYIPRLRRPGARDEASALRLGGSSDGG